VALGNQVICNLGNLATGASVQIQIIIIPGTAGTIQNVVDVRSNEVDPNPANNTVTTSIQVQ